MDGLEIRHGQRYSRAMLNSTPWLKYSKINAAKDEAPVTRN